MPQICLYFQLHQPFRIGTFEIFDLGNKPDYFLETSHASNKSIFHKVAEKSYIPMLTLLNELIATEPRFCFALSCSGVFLEQAEEYDPRVIDLLQKLVKTGRVEILAETYHHSLSFLYSETEFVTQIEMHRGLVHRLFGVRPKVFRNTELIYSDHIGYMIGKLGYAGMLTEGVDRYLHGRPRTQVYVSHPFRVEGTEQVLPLLLKHAQLSDDIAFRFSDKHWKHHPLSVEKYLHWLSLYGEDEIINLFMDFETFGEHQWADSGIFEFFKHLVYRFAEAKWNRFETPSHIFANWRKQQLKSQAKGSKKPPVRPSTWHKPVIYDVPIPISWADVDRDLTAWIDNELQQDALRTLYGLESALITLADLELLAVWRKLQTSDHFYYMCTKWSADGDVHAYFSPYGSPFEAYRRFAIVMADFKAQLAARQAERASVEVRVAATK